jgi:hypothetical protein
MSLNVFYRLSETNANKRRLDMISNKACLDNFLKEFSPEQTTIIADNVNDDTLKWLETYSFKSLHRTSLGNSGSFWFSFNLAQNLPSDDYVYFVENDYIHKPKSRSVLLEGLNMADYVTLYDHPDKYVDGINREIKNGGEKTKVILTSSSHWKYTNSTTLTFASRVSLLKKDAFVFKLFTVGIIKRNLPFLKVLQAKRIPRDYRIFYFLIKFKSRTLISPIPGYSTHGESEFIAPLIDWEQYII